MTDAQIIAIARVFDQEWIEHKGSGATPDEVKIARAMWLRLYGAVAREIYNMHGKRGETIFRKRTIFDV